MEIWKYRNQDDDKKVKKNYFSKLQSNFRIQYYIIYCTLYTVSSRHCLPQNRYKRTSYVLRFLENFRKLSTKKTTKLETYSNCCAFLKILL